MSSLILVRHCESSGQGPEASLSTAGVHAADALINRLAALDPDAIYSSPFARAIATVEPFSRHSGLVMTIDDRLRERLLSSSSLEDWLTHIRRSFADPTYRAPGGESLLDAQERALAAVSEIASKPHRLPILASHGNLISTILRSVDPEFGFEDWRALRNPDLFEIRLRRGRPIAYDRLD